jgi:N-acetylmuramoyl-L-alanine amidase
LALAKEVVELLESADVKTQMIGKDGAANILTERTAKDRGATLFVSLHHDSVQREWMGRAAEFSGYAIFVSQKNPLWLQSLDCGRRIGHSLRASGFRPSRYHAIPVAGENRPFADEASGVHYFNDLVVLKTATQPAILIEGGVAVNPVDERQITAHIGRRELATAIATGIRQCVSP